MSLVYFNVVQNRNAVSKATALKVSSRQPDMRLKTTQPDRLEVRFSAETDKSALQQQAIIKAVATYLGLPDDAPFQKIQIAFLERATSAMLDNNLFERVEFLTDLQDKLEKILLDRNQWDYIHTNGRFLVTTELAHLVYKALKLDDIDSALLP